MMLPVIVRAVSAAAVLAMAMPALAVATSPLEVTSHLLVDRRVALPGGEVRREQVAAAHAVPGDRVTVVVAYRNNGAVPLANLAVSNPVPRGLRFRGEGSAGLESSIDGTRFAPLAALTVRLPGGGTRPALADDVVAVRWRPATPLAARSAGQFSFAAIVR